MFSPTSTLQHAPCRDLSNTEKDSVFFPSGGTGYKRAQMICAGCRDKDECLDMALAFETSGVKRHGIWGGLTVRERNRIYGDTCPDEDIA